MPNLIGDLLRDGIVSLLIGSYHLHVNGSGQAEIENLSDDIGRLKEEFHSWKMFRQKLSQMPHERGLRRMMLRIKGDENFRVTTADRPVGTVRLVDAGIGEADIVQNSLQLSRRNFPAECILNLVAQSCRLFHAQSGAGPDVQPQQPGIHIREEVLPEKVIEPQREQAENQEAHSEYPAMVEGRLQQGFISTAKVLEFALKPPLKAPKIRCRSLCPMLMAAHDVHHQSRNERPRQQVAREHGETDSFRQ